MIGVNGCAVEMEREHPPLSVEVLWKVTSDWQRVLARDRCSACVRDNQRLKMEY